MILVTPAVVLARRPHGEADRIVTLYTPELGKAPARFGGVDRPYGKLKSLCEPMVAGDFRLHLRRGAEFARGLGGAIRTAYPGLRRDFAATVRGLEMLALLDLLTPAFSPSPAKYALVVEALAVLDAGAARPGAAWLPAAFALRLLEAAGFASRERRVSGGNEALWRALHEAPLAELLELPVEGERISRLEGFLQRSVERVTEKPFEFWPWAAAAGSPRLSAGAPRLAGGAAC